MGASGERDPARRLRHLVLEGVGAKGQEEIERARVVVPALDSIVAARIAVRYLAGALVGELIVTEPELAQEAEEFGAHASTHGDACAPEPTFPDAALESLARSLGPGARDVALGSLAALRILRSVVDQSQATSERGEGRDG